MPRKVLLAIAATFIVAAVILAVSGGFRTTVGGFRISARSPLAASIAALIAGAAWFALARRDRAIATDLETAWGAIERNASRLIGCVALISFVVAAAFATRSASGADASGYLSQAQLWYEGKYWLQDGISLVLHEKLPDLEPGQWITTPLGWRPMGLPGMQAPTYPPGLPMLMSIPHGTAGIVGVTALISASAALAVWSAGMMAGGVAGVIAAISLALSPVFLYQSIQPMSDVPATAAWMAAFVVAARTSRSFDAGLLCALAVLIRPNLAPLAIAPLMISKNKWAFAIPLTLAAILLMLVQRFWYGSPFKTGYGPVDGLFALANVGPNAIRYVTWLVATAPVMLLAPLGFARLKSDRQAQALAAFAVFVVTAYLVYGVFEHWSYLRFLLPALAVFAIFAAVELSAWIDRWPISSRAPILFGLVLGVSAFSLSAARSRDTFKLADQLRRVEQVADFINDRVPSEAVLLSGEQSGSMRYYTHRPIVRWEAATPEMLSKVVVALEESGARVYIVLDAWENEPFLAKFKDVPAVALDWPPIVDAGTSHRTRVWNLSDRARFLNGGQISTTRLQ